AVETTFSVTVPPPGRTDFVSPSSRSVTIDLSGKTLLTMDVAVGSPSCAAGRNGARICIASKKLAPGSYVFAVTAFDGPRGTGTQLAAGNVAATIASGKNDLVRISLRGTAASLSLSIADPYPPAGTPATTVVRANALDADGNVIVGQYASPIILSDSDASGATALSSTSVADSAAKVDLAYTGAPLSVATIGAATGGVRAVTKPFVPSARTVAQFTPPPVVVHGNPLPAGLSDLCVGPDGNVWVTAASTGAIMKFERDKFITYPVLGSEPTGLAVGSDRAMWFAEMQDGKIGRITTEGRVTSFKIPVAKGETSQPAWVTLGPDGRIWFVDQGLDAVGAISAGGAIATYPLPARSFPQEIVTGPDKNLWITDDGTNAIDVVSPSGKLLAKYRLPTPNAGPWGIAVGPDKNLWFAEFEVNRIARVTLHGSVTEWQTPSGFSGPLNVAAGPDGNVWFTEMGGGEWNLVGKVAYITTDGRQIHEFASTPDEAHVHNLAFDARGDLFYTQFNVGYSALSKFVY
ncbi:MAG TPA: hypothetical protein VMF61_13540, partial [Candidatus Acidoferrales bacterium]|nr:hypothetical protein [Candidatus Acidoferrales bacterium]